MRYLIGAAAVAATLGVGTFALLPQQAAAQSTPYTWKSVRMGGGGYVTGLFAHPAEADLMYIRTDVGGIFRWNPAGSNWIPLLDTFATRWNNQPNYFKIESLALDPQNTSVLYASVGKYADDWGKPGALLKSDDRGANWRVVSPPDWGVKVGAEADKKWGGERLMVSPFDSNIVLYGSRRFGMWRSVDAGANWTRLDFGTPTDFYGYSAIVFQPVHGGFGVLLGLGRRCVRIRGQRRDMDESHRFTDAGGSHESRLGRHFHHLPERRVPRMGKRHMDGCHAAGAGR